MSGSVPIPPRKKTGARARNENIAIPEGLFAPEADINWRYRDGVPILLSQPDLEVSLASATRSRIRYSFEDIDTADHPPEEISGTICSTFA